jgi:molybdate-binding protein
MTGADASLGLRALAMAFDLDFVSLATVRCDLVIPSDLLEHPTLNIVLEVLDSAPFRNEMASLPGYGTEALGKVIAEF